MQTTDIAQTLNTLYAELIDGAPSGGLAYMLNSGDAGLLASVDKLSAAAASRGNGGATIAAHVEHLRYGLSLMNRWAAGDRDAWKSADWTAAWRTTSVNDDEWRRLRAAFREEAGRWLEAVKRPRDVSVEELNIVVGNIAHLAYHLGAIRQIDRTARGPAAS